jgi:hypothetical protein
MVWIRQRLQTRVGRLVAKIYAFVFPVLSAFGLVGLLLAVWFRRTRPILAPILALTLASAMTIGMRIALLSFLEVTSIPSGQYPLHVACFSLRYLVRRWWRSTGI